MAYIIFLRYRDNFHVLLNIYIPIHYVMISSNFSSCDSDLVVYVLLPGYRNLLLRIFVVKSAFLSDFWLHKRFGRYLKRSKKTISEYLQSEQNQRQAQNIGTLLSQIILKYVSTLVMRIFFLHHVNPFDGSDVRQSPLYVMKYIYLILYYII